MLTLCFLLVITGILFDFPFGKLFAIVFVCVIYWILAG